MNMIVRLRRVAAVAAGLGLTMVAFAGAASASTASLPRPSNEAGPPQTSPIIHTVVVGGMPGWQIALIAIGAALAAATIAVLLDRLRSARRLPVTGRRLILGQPRDRLARRLNQRLPERQAAGQWRLLAGWGHADAPGTSRRGRQRPGRAGPVLG